MWMVTVTLLFLLALPVSPSVPVGKEGGSAHHDPVPAKTSPQVTSPTPPPVPPPRSPSKPGAEAEEHEAITTPTTRSVYLHRAFAADFASNWGLVMVGIAAALVTWRTLIALRAQTNVANRTLIATLRPKLIVRKVTMSRGTKVPVLGVEDARPWTVDFDIANVGQGIANVLSLDFFIARYEGGLLPDRYEPAGKPFHLQLEPGEERRISNPMPLELVEVLRALRAHDLEQGYQSTDQIYFYGIVKYEDRLGTKRNTAVCRHYNNKLKGFRAVDDSDREYAD